jgi:hypothetical protein
MAQPIKAGMRTPGDVAFTAGRKTSRKGRFFEFDSLEVNMLPWSDPDRLKPSYKAWVVWHN